MKIDEASINHNAVKLIKNAADVIWDTDYENDQGCRAAAVQLAYVCGIADMAETMKEVLKA